MVASLTILTGRPKAAAKSKPTQPGPRLPGSERGPFGPTSAGQPTEIASYSQSRASPRTVSTRRAGVKSRPVGDLRGSVCPDARILIFVPPISTERILAGAGRTDCASLNPSADCFRSAASAGVAGDRPGGGVSGAGSTGCTCCPPAPGPAWITEPTASGGWGCSLGAGGWLGASSGGGASVGTGHRPLDSRVRYRCN